MTKDDFIYLLIANFICTILSLCTYKYASYEKLIVFYKQENSKIYFFSVNLLIYIVTAKWVWNFKRHEFLDEIALYLVIPIVFILANLFFLQYQMKNNELLGTVSGNANWNQGPGGDPCGCFNKWDPLCLTFDCNVIKRIRICGRANQTLIDNLTICVCCRGLVVNN